MILNFLQKYQLLLFLIANATAEYILFMSVSKYLFYTVLGISIPLLFNQAVLSPSSIRQCPHIYLLGSILILYQLLFNPEPSSSESLTYFVGKLATFGIMVLCISKNFEFYWKKSILPFSYIILALIILGWFVNRTGFGFHSGLTFGFTNRNAACAIASIGFAGFLFGNEAFKKTDYICMAILFLTVLMGGSRNSLAMCFIFIIVRFGLSLRLACVAMVLMLVIIFVLPEMGVKIEAFSRLVGTITGDIATDREVQRHGAEIMIGERPWTGWGWGNLMHTRALQTTSVGAHNGYLTFLIYMGYPLGGAFISVLGLGAISRLSLYRLKDNAINYHLAVMLSILFAANQEDFLIGVNQIVTNMFFMSFIVTGFSLYYYRNGIMCE